MLLQGIKVNHVEGWEHGGRMVDKQIPKIIFKYNSGGKRDPVISQKG
jgi:hypothetical protein